MPKLSVALRSGYLQLEFSVFSVRTTEIGNSILNIFSEGSRFLSIFWEKLLELKITISPPQSMMANLGCQHDCIWSQWKPKVLGTSGYLIRLLQAGRPILDFGWTFWWQSTSKDTGQGSVGVFACFLLFFLASLSILLLYGIKSNFFRIPMQSENQQLFWNPQGLQAQTGSAETASLVDETTVNSCPFVRIQSVLDYPDHTHSQALW